MTSDELPDPVQAGFEADLEMRLDADEYREAVKNWVRSEIMAGRNPESGDLDPVRIRRAKALQALIATEGGTDDE
jgi:hypothetical protein